MYEGQLVLAIQEPRERKNKRTEDPSHRLDGEDYDDADALLIPDVYLHHHIGNMGRFKPFDHCSHVHFWNRWPSGSLDGVARRISRPGQDFHSPMARYALGSIPDSSSATCRSKASGY